ncbi:hypothetical protein [Lysobacter sp. FW306-1B-D06B]|uniref:hypothetical protein n=1 Tax=Lysobacter sp. FW306-1B-D06B TaxID=3140250 RepID=UPI00313FFB10
MAELIKTWAPILVPLLGLIAGTGWLQYFLARRREKRAEELKRIEGFLRPFQATLKSTAKLAGQLRENGELSALEYNPAHLKKHFANLPAGDVRRTAWKAYISLLHDENRHGIALVEANIGTASPEFRTALEDYLLHVKKWRYVWDALDADAGAEEPPDEAGMLIADPFPKDVERLLETELEAALRKVGRRGST